jgi:hypothetical protein
MEVSLSDHTMTRLRKVAKEGGEAGISFLTEDLTDEKILIRFIFAGEAFVQERIADRKAERERCHLK